MTKRPVMSRARSRHSNSRLMNIRRSPEFVELNPWTIELPDFEEDPRFAQLYNEVMLGRRKIAYTRIPTDEIQCGFSRQRADGTMEAIDLPPSPMSDVRMIAQAIRGGHRPALFVYPGGHELGRTHVCSDDCTALRAYQMLGFLTVPVIVMDFSTQTLRHPALVFRNIDTETKQGTESIFESVILPDRLPGVPRLHRDPIPVAESQAVFSDLSERLIASLQQLRRFHQSDGAVHYHETLGSALVRAIRILRAISSLSLRHTEQALILLRALYELSLNMHLDWLAPERIGPIFLLHGRQISGRETNDAIEQVEKERLKAGWNAKAAKESKRSLRSLLDLVQKAERKAEIYPLGVHHRGIYALLSHQSHQDFVAGESFLNALVDNLDVEEMTYPNMQQDTAMTLQLADCFVTHILVCTEGDMGSE